MTATLWERRKFFRIPTSGKALLRHGVHLEGLYRLHDLSMGGCLLTHGPDCALQERVIAALRVEGEDGIELSARVVRQERSADGVHVRLCFTEQEPSFEDRIQDLVMRSIEREQHSEILIVHEQPERLERLLVTMRAIGQSIVLARTPWDALTVLESGAMRIDLAIIAPTLGQSSVREFMRIVLRRFPQMQCVMLSPGGVGRLVHAIRTSAFDDRLPWTLTHLREVISQHELIVGAGV
jgi:PilZ domain